MLFALISMGILVARYLPLLIKNSNNATAEIKEQFLSIPVFGIDKHIEVIRILAKQCGLPTHDIKNLVVDHMTYYAVNESQNPIHVLYISEAGFGGDLAEGKLEPFLRKLPSPGLLIRCTYLPPQLTKLPRIERDGYCCINLATQ